MGVKVTSIINATMNQLPVKLADGVTVFLLPGCKLENVEVDHVEELQPFARIVVAPSEGVVKPKRQRING